MEEDERCEGDGGRLGTSILGRRKDKSVYLEGTLPEDCHASPPPDSVFTEDPVTFHNMDYETEVAVTTSGFIDAVSYTDTNSTCSTNTVQSSVDLVDGSLLSNTPTSTPPPTRKRNRNNPLRHYTKRRKKKKKSSISTKIKIKTAKVSTPKPLPNGQVTSYDTSSFNQGVDPLTGIAKPRRKSVKEIWAGIPGLSLKPRKRNNQKLSHAAQLRQTQEGCIDLETPNSILVHTNLRSLINAETFTRLPPNYQYKLLQLLPKCDKITNNDCTLRMSQTALNNEFFNKSCGEWTQRLSEGEFTEENHQRIKSEEERQQTRLDPWKLKHFEQFWGQKSKTVSPAVKSPQTLLSDDDVVLSHNVDISTDSTLATTPTVPPLKIHAPKATTASSVQHKISSHQKNTGTTFAGYKPLAKIGSSSSESKSTFQRSETVSRESTFQRSESVSKSESTLQGRESTLQRSDLVSTTPPVASNVIVSSNSAKDVHLQQKRHIESSLPAVPSKKIKQTAYPQDKYITQGQQFTNAQKTLHSPPQKPLHSPPHKTVQTPPHKALQSPPLAPGAAQPRHNYVQQQQRANVAQPSRPGPAKVRQSVPGHKTKTLAEIKAQNKLKLNQRRPGMLQGRPPPPGSSPNHSGSLSPRHGNVRVLPTQQNTAEQQKQPSSIISQIFQNTENAARPKVTATTTTATISVQQKANVPQQSHAVTQQSHVVSQKPQLAASQQSRAVSHAQISQQSRTMPQQLQSVTQQSRTMPPQSQSPKAAPPQVVTQTVVIQQRPSAAANSVVSAPQLVITQPQGVQPQAAKPVEQKTKIVISPPNQAPTTHQVVVQQQRAPTPGTSGTSNSLPQGTTSQTSTLMISNPVAQNTSGGPTVYMVDPKNCRAAGGPSPSISSSVHQPQQTTNSRTNNATISPKSMSKIGATVAPQNVAQPVSAQLGGSKIGRVDNTGNARPGTKVKLYKVKSPSGETHFLISDNGTSTLLRPEPSRPKSVHTMGSEKTILPPRANSAPPVKLDGPAPGTKIKTIVIKRSSQSIQNTSGNTLSTSGVKYTHATSHAPPQVNPATPYPGQPKPPLQRPPPYTHTNNNLPTIHSVQPGRTLPNMDNIQNIAPPGTNQDNIPLALVNMLNHVTNGGSVPVQMIPPQGTTVPTSMFTQGHGGGLTSITMSGGQVDKTSQISQTQTKTDKCVISV